MLINYFNIKLARTKKNIYLCAVTFLQQIQNYISSSRQVLRSNLFGGGFGNWNITDYPFADTLFYTITDKISDLCNDVNFYLLDGASENKKALFLEFRIFFERYGQVVVNRLYESGFVVVGMRAGSFYILRDDEYVIDNTKAGGLVVRSKNSDVKIYVFKSRTYLLKGRSDKQLAEPFLKFYDNVINSSNTISERLGSLVLISPESQQGLPTPIVLTKSQKEKLEKDLSEEYGSLSKQKQIMMLSRTMRAQIINLAGLDQHTMEKVKMAVCAVCDIIKVPANQIALIDANSSKSLSNGSELLEGDFSKYQTFERVLNATWGQFARDLGLHVDYDIYNKPKRNE